MNTTTPNVMIPPAPDPPVIVTRAEFDELMHQIAVLTRRSVRTETKLTRLMEFQGLDGHGQPLKPEPTGSDSSQ